MKSSLGGRQAGAGTALAFIESEDTWRDHKVAVRLPHDRMSDGELAALSGPVTITRLERGDETWTNKP